MFKKIYKFFLELLINDNKKTMKGNEKMPTKTLKMPRAKISSTEFEKHAIVGEIKRIGKNIFIVDEQGIVSPVSQKHVKGLSTSVLKNRNSAIIKANGLSRAQVGRIAGDLKNNSSYGVYIRKVAAPKLGKPQATNFEILLTDGKNNEIK